MTTREKIIVGVMCLTIVYGAYELMGSGTTKKPVAEPKANPQEELRGFVAEVSKKMATGTSSKDSQYIVNQAGTAWTRDPFLQSTLLLKQQRAAQASAPKRSDAAGSKSAFAYTGFLQLGNTKLAVINGMEYALGDALKASGFYLKRVSAEEVVIGRVDGSEAIHVPLTELD